MMAPMAQTSHILWGLQALYAMPSHHLDTRSRIQLCNPIARSSSASCLNKRILTNTNAFRIFGCSGFESGPLGDSTFRFACGGGAGGRFGGTGGGRSSSVGVPNGNNWSLLSWYLSLLDKYPVMTKAFTGALLNLVGDLI